MAATRVTVSVHSVALVTEDRTFEVDPFTWAKLADMEDEDVRYALLREQATLVDSQVVNVTERRDTVALGLTRVEKVK